MAARKKPAPKKEKITIKPGQVFIVVDPDVISEALEDGCYNLRVVTTQEELNSAMNSRPRWFVGEVIAHNSGLFNVDNDENYALRAREALTTKMAD